MSSRTKTTNPWIVLVVLCCGFFMILLDTTVVQIAIPNMLDGLHTTLDQILWVVNAYILVYAVLLITAGRLGDVYGQRNLFALGLVIFTASSAYCGLAPDVTHLVAARVLQGIGGALLTPQTLAILTTLFPPDKRGAAFGVWGGIAGIAAIAGPTLGGFLVTNFSWRWIFFINLPIGVLTLIATFILIPDMRVGQSHRFDIVGVLLASAGLFGIVFGLIEGQRFNWGSIVGPISVPLILALGVLVMGIFVWWEARQAEPLVPLPLFRDRNFSLMNWISLAVSFGMLGFFLPVVIYFQSVLGLTALQTGLAILPMSGFTMVIAPVAGRLADKFGGKYFLFGGNLLFALGMAWLALSVNATAGEWSFLPCFLLAGFGLGMVFAPMATVAMRNIKPDMAGAASGVFNTTRQLGSVIGTAVVGAILQNRLAVDLVSEAQNASQSLPQQFRAQFLQGIEQAAQGG
ncbi:MAG: DHA2 family efflux MFS transporter permease subunit, partial [Chloroflexi bacterium]|nr:DHA2 family efflux MFS transporter permease subunit [Chloroflexota bacterium]